MTKRLKRTVQCDKCPWRKDVDPHDIPDGYSVARHEGLRGTIAIPGDFSRLGQPIAVMACHETANTHCVGWLANQLGEGNNIPLRVAMRGCENIQRLRLVGEQHQTFDDTLPKGHAMAKNNVVSAAARRSMTQPVDWWEAWEARAQAAGMSLSAWVGQQCNAALPKRVQSGLSDRRPAHRPTENSAK